MYQIIILSTETIKESKHVISTAKNCLCKQWRPLASGFFTGSRKLLLRVYSFTLPRFPILVGRSLFSTALFVFRQVEKYHFYRPKNKNNSFIRVKKSNKHVAGGYRKLLRVFKREVVQFLVAKIVAVSHLQMEALPAVQT